MSKATFKFPRHSKGRGMSKDLFSSDIITRQSAWPCWVFLLAFSIKSGVSPWFMFHTYFGACAKKSWVLEATSSTCFLNGSQTCLCPEAGKLVAGRYQHLLWGRAAIQVNVYWWKLCLMNTYSWEIELCNCTVLAACSIHIHNPYTSSTKWENNWLLLGCA